MYASCTRDNIVLYNKAKTKLNRHEALSHFWIAKFTLSSFCSEILSKQDELCSTARPLRVYLMRQIKKLDRII